MTRSGIGFDSHRLTADRRLVIGGIEIPHELGLDGHSDADVLTHAVIDALLGAAGLGDIGEHFPDDQERWRGADSIGLLQMAMEAIRQAGFEPVNIDCTVIMEAPKLSPHKTAIRARLADAIRIEPERINVKASTGERIGFVGRGEGVAALAVVTLSEPA
jgi:2-C-methyl-D-erythritol 2,4-cyclodiphosphate synthase